MGINKYDSPSQDRYISTYVPLPYEQIMATVASRQAQSDRIQEAMNKTFEDTKNLTYIPGSPDETYIRDYVGKVSNLVQENLTADFSNPIAVQQMRFKFNTMTNRQDIQNIQTSHDTWATNQKYKAQLKAQGLYDPALDEDPASQWDTVTGGKTYDYITSPFKNPRPTAETYFNNIKPTSLPQEGNFYVQGVTSGKINEVSEAKWNEFANTSEGSLYVKKIAKEQGLDYTDPTVRKQIATEYLKGVGKEFTYIDKSPLPEYMSSGANQPTTYTPYKMPTVTTPAEGVLGNKKYTAKNVYKGAEQVATEISTQEQKIQDMTNAGADENVLNQKKLDLQSLKEKHSLLQGTIDSATSIVEERYKSSYDSAVQKYIDIAEKKGISADEATKQYNAYSSIKELDNALKWNISTPGIVTGMEPLEFPMEPLLVIGSAFANILKAPAAFAKEIATMATDPVFKNNMKEEFDRVKSGDQSVGEAIKNTFKENKQYYNDFVAPYLVDKDMEYLNIGKDEVSKKLRKNVIDIYKNVNTLDRSKQAEIDKIIEDGGIKSESGVAILPIPSGVDEYGQMYAIGLNNRKVSDQVMMDVSTLTKRIKDNPESFALSQESAANPKDTKNKNKEIIDLQESVRTADYILPTHYLPQRNDDGTYDVSFTTYHKPGGKGNPIASRVIEVRLSQRDQRAIETVSSLINEAGYPISAARVANPDIERNIKANASATEIKMEPFPSLGQYTVKKVEGGWQIFYPDGKPILEDNVNNKEVGVISNIEDVINYMYKVRVTVFNKMQNQQ